MIELRRYPLALQLLMQTDGTVTELIKLLAQEDIQVIKLSETINKIRVLNRHIFLQGKHTGQNWLHAESKIYLDHLPDNFVKDLLEKSVPIGTLWANYRIETFKQPIKQFAETCTENKQPGFECGTKLLGRTYHVFNKQQIIMEITEKFPVKHYLQVLPS